MGATATANIPEEARFAFDAPPSVKQEPSAVRHVVLFALACAAILCYLLRVSISTAGTTVQADLGLDSVQMGEIFGAFFVGYLWFQIPAGWAGHRVGARISLPLMGLCWAAAMVVSATATGESSLYWSRAALGAGQAGLFAVTIMALRDWFPTTRRGFASSVITSCMSVGAVLSSALTVRLIIPLGWRWTFLTYAGLAVAWSMIFAYWFRDKPEQHARVNKDELALIRGEHAIEAGTKHSASPTISTFAALGAMARSPAMWALCVQSFFQAYAYVFFITWFPAYLEKAHAVKLTQAGDLTMLPLAATVMGSFLGGVLIDAILVRTGSKWLSRSGSAAAALAVCALATLGAGSVREPTGAVAVITLGMFFSGIAKPNQWAATMDLTGSHSAIGFAVMNIAGNFGALVCPRVLGYMFDDIEKNGGDWNSVLYLVAGVNLAAAVSWLLLNPNRPAVPSES